MSMTVGRFNRFKEQQALEKWGLAVIDFSKDLDKGRFKERIAALDFHHKYLFNNILNETLENKPLKRRKLYENEKEKD